MTTTIKTYISKSSYFDIIDELNHEHSIDSSSSSSSSSTYTYTRDYSDSEYVYTFTVTAMTVCITYDSSAPLAEFISSFSSIPTPRILTYALDANAFDIIRRELHIECDDEYIDDFCVFVSGINDTYIVKTFECVAPYTFIQFSSLSPLASFIDDVITGVLD